MPVRLLTPASNTDIDRPSCKTCGSRMWLRRITDRLSKQEMRTFECPVCEVSHARP